MHFAVHHATHYRYDPEVTLGAHVVRLTPRPEGVRLHSHSLEVTPLPVEQRDVEDCHGNRIVELRFAGTTRELAIHSRFALETLPAPSLAGPLPRLPWTVAMNVGADPSGPDIAYRAPAPVDASVQAFAQGMAADVAGEPIAFLDHLTRTIYGRFERHIRPTGAANPAAETLASGRGACRDLAVLFIDACRSLGIASRFVSGYQAQAQTADGQRHLHAWPEVRLPGLGFRGWDPMHGVRVAEGHVALCAAPEQSGTMPVEGAYSFAGARLDSTLDFAIEIVTS